MVESAPFWFVVDMPHALYSSVMAKKPVTRSIRLDEELFVGVEKLARRLHERNMPRGATWNDALKFALGYLEMLSFLEDPDRLIDANQEAGRRRPSDPDLKPAKK